MTTTTMFQCLVLLIPLPLPLHPRLPHPPLQLHPLQLPPLHRLHPPPLQHRHASCSRRIQPWLPSGKNPKRLPRVGRVSSCSMSMPRLCRIRVSTSVSAPWPTWCNRLPFPCGGSPTVRRKTCL